MFIFARRGFSQEKQALSQTHTHTHLHIGPSHHTKFKQKLMSQSQENFQKEGWTEGWTDRMTELNSEDPSDHNWGYNK